MKKTKLERWKELGLLGAIEETSINSNMKMEIGPMTEWISVKDQMPPFLECHNSHTSYLLAYHTVFGVGVAWFWKFKYGDGIKEELEEDFKDRYLCSCHFIKNKTDGNDLIDDERDIDIFEHSPDFINLGTVTHWMPLPEAPT